MFAEQMRAAVDGARTLTRLDELSRSLWQAHGAGAVGLMGWTPPTALVCQSGGVEHHLREASMGEVSTIGVDLAKNVFQVHGADASGAVVFRKKLRRSQVLIFPCFGGRG